MRREERIKTHKKKFSSENSQKKRGAMDDPDTDSVVELAIHNILGSAAAQSGYDLIEF